MKYAIYVALGFLIGFSSRAQIVVSRQDMNKMNWLVGSWKGMASNKPFYEAWRKVNDSVMVNFSIEIKEKDTVVKESDGLFLKGSNAFLGNKPSQWKLTRLTTNEIVLENDTLKFSNRIIWLHTVDDHWFTILQHPRQTVYYDIIRLPALDAVVDRFIEKSKNKK